MWFEKEYFEMALSYKAYNNYAEKLLLKISNSSASSMQYYAKVNLKILQDLKNSVHLANRLSDALSNTDPIILVILTEGYCGDSAQVFPVLGKMQELFPDKVDIKVILRDEHLDIADHYYKSRAIPMIICLDKQSMKEKFVWGSRPKPAQHIMDTLKSKNATQQEKSIALHDWYAQDRTLTLQNELTELLISKG